MFAVLAVFLLAPQESEIDILKAELRKTKLQLVDAKRKIRKLESQVQKAKDAGFSTDTNAITSVIPILKRIPQEYDPSKNKIWDQAELQAINRSLRSEVGKRFICKARIYKTSISINPAHLRDNSQPKYKAIVEYNNPKFTNSGHVILQSIANRTPSHPYVGIIEFYGNESLNRDFKKTVKVNSFLTVDGTISEITISKTYKNEIHFRLSLINREYKPAILN